MEFFTAIPMDIKHSFNPNKSNNDIFVSFNGQQSTLHYFNYDLPIKNHNLVQFNGESYRVPLDYLINPTEYKKFRDTVDEGVPFKQKISDASIHTIHSFVARYCSNELYKYVSPINVLKKDIAGTNRKLEDDLSKMSDSEFGNIFFQIVRKDYQQKQKIKKSKSIRNEISLER